MTTLTSTDFNSIYGFKRRHFLWAKVFFALQSWSADYCS